MPERVAPAEGNVAAVERFLRRLGDLAPAELEPAVPPVLNRDPYLSAWTNVEAALGNAPPEMRSRLVAAAEIADARLRTLELPPVLGTAARRAVRALLVRTLPGTDESVALVYQPFETLVPLASLEATPGDR
jgi:hypothetical protein